MKIMLADFNTKLEGEYIFKPTTENEIQHSGNNDNDVRIENFAT
jgi:hypothetical protein